MSERFTGGSEDPRRDQLAIAPNAVIGNGVTFGSFVVIGRVGDEPVEIGDRTVLGDHVFIESGAVIGADCTIGAGCTIGANVRIAPSTAVAPGTRFGSTSAGGFQEDGPASTVVRRSSAVSPHALIASNVSLGEAVEIGPFAIVGWDGEEPVTIGAGTKIAPFALIEPGAIIGADCQLDAYCRLGFRSTLGNESRLLYGAAVFEEVRIGRACIVGGDIADRTILEDFVTYFGEVAHNYRHPGDLADWDGKPTKSPIIRTRSIVAQNAIIVGGREIGPSSYVAAGEIVHVNVPPEMLYQRRLMTEISKTRGLVRTRQDGLDT